MNKQIIKSFFLPVLVLFLIGTLVYMYFNRKLDLNGDKAQELYSYLGGHDATECAGLLYYIPGTSTYDETEKDLLICASYLQVKESGEEVEFESTKNNVCKHDGITMETTEDGICEATKYDIEDLEDAYFNMYNEEIEENVPFYLNKNKQCSYSSEDESYYCYKHTDEDLELLLGNSSLYKTMKSAIESPDGTVIILEYFINLIGTSACYTDFTTYNQRYTCSRAISEDDSFDGFDIAFMKQHAVTFRHTFKESNGNTYWVSTEKIA